MTLSNRVIFPFALAALVLAAAPVSAAETFAAQLSGAEQVPDPIKTPATGQLELVVSGQSVSYTLSVKDINNPAAGDLHLGPVGANGPLVVKLFPTHGAAPKKGAFSGVLAQGKFDASDLIGPMAGASLSELLEQLRDGNAYVNVHTNDGVAPTNTGPGDFPGGEIRGQLDLHNHD